MTCAAFGEARTYVSLWKECAHVILCFPPVRTEVGSCRGYDVNARTPDVVGITQKLKYRLL